MEIHFDNRTVQVLRYIYNHNGVTEEKVTNKFDGDLTSMLLVNLALESYIIIKDNNGKGVAYESNKLPRGICYDYTLFTTSKANLVVQNADSVLWKWLMPLIFSALSLAISFVTLLLKFF